jgi:acyl-CoA reductase-like NAD-dependent aldehyde dehydrogenase
MLSAVYGLAAGVFTQDIDRAIRTAHRLQAGTAWVRLSVQFIDLAAVHPRKKGELLP